MQHTSLSNCDYPYIKSESLFTILNEKNLLDEINTSFNTNQYITHLQSAFSIYNSHFLDDSSLEIWSSNVNIDNCYFYIEKDPCFIDIDSSNSYYV